MKRKHQAEFNHTLVADEFHHLAVAGNLELEAIKVWLGENYQVPERREPGMVLQQVGRAW